MLVPHSKVLVLAPHTDDMELGCGGLVSRLTFEFASDVSCVCFSAAEESVSPNFDSDILRREAPAAGAALGVDSSKYSVLRYPVRRFHEFRQNILDEMIKLTRNCQYDLVVVPASSDQHQDHQIIHNEACRAFKATSIIGYHFPWNCFVSKHHFVVQIAREDLDRKILALQAFKSQQSRKYMDSVFLESSAIYTGSLIGVSYAESYEVIRMVSRVA